MNPEVMYVAGRIKPGRQDWEVLGVYRDEKKAREACTKTFDFIGPVTVDEFLGDEPSAWPLMYYPNAF